MLAETLERLGRAKWHKSAYTWGLYLSYALFAVAFTGVLRIDPQYLVGLETAIKYYVCAFLLIRFNPLTHKRAHSAATAEFDRRIAFAAGVFLLLTTAVTGIAASYAEKAKTTLERAVASGSSLPASSGSS